MNDGTWDEDGNGGGFVEVAAQAGVDNGGNSNAAATGDYDNDGVPEIFVAQWLSGGAAANVLHRKTDAVMANRALFVRPVDATGHTHSARTFGAVVVLFEAGTTTRVPGGVRAIGSGVCYQAQGRVADVAFYVDDPTEAVDIEVRFPSTGGAPVVVRSENVVPNDLSSDRIVEVERTA